MKNGPPRVEGSMVAVEVNELSGPASPSDTFTGTKTDRRRKEWVNGSKWRRSEMRRELQGTTDRNRDMKMEEEEPTEAKVRA